MTISIIDPHIYNRIVQIRRQLHQYPELSLQEQQTANVICQELDALGVAYERNVGGHGIVAKIPGKMQGPCVALRADMDALPIHEATGLPFASVHEGVMHACGHDGHTSMLLGAAMLLVKEDLPVPVKLIFQPAEEISEGAKAMIKAGVLDNVGAIFGLHIDRHYPAGTIMVSDDYVNAASDRFYIEISGQSGHAARPHETVDAVIVGALIVSTLQTIISREIDPAHPSVITVGKFFAGTAANVIAGQATLEGSIRSQAPEVRNHLFQAIQRIAESAGQLHDAKVTVQFKKGTPALKNDPEMATLAKQATQNALGDSGLAPRTALNMGGEDFSYYLEHVPGAVVRVGGQFKDKDNYPAHSSEFDFDETALAVGARYFYEVAGLASRQLFS